MAKKSLYLSGIGITIILGMILNWWFCCNPSPQAQETFVSKDPLPILTSPLIINDADGDFVYNSNDNFNFKVSGFTLLEPISKSVESVVDSLKSYIEGNPTKQVNITGFYKDTEKNTSAYPDLGIARAVSVKNYFVSKGISAKQINTKGALKDSLTLNDSIYIGPLLLDIITVKEDTTSDDSEILKSMGEKIKEDPLVLYFGSGESNLDLSVEQREKIAAISQYLDKAEGASCIVTGHTDNTGLRATNMKLGIDRANKLKDYLIQNGISADKIGVASKGPDAPIASNKTEEGRSKNRRTEVTIN
jgi:OmpA-OmpF porin, OOP family